MDSTEFIIKYRILTNEEFPFEKDKIDSIIKERIEFSRSLELFKKIKKQELNRLPEVDKLIQFFIEIVSIEMLLRDGYGKAGDEFSKRGF